MAYDPVRDRLLIFGGYSASGPSNEVWALSMSGSPTLTQLAVSGTPPAARGDASVIYDSARDRLVVFAGVGLNGAVNDAWELTLSGTPTWSEISPVGAPPSTRYSHTAIYDTPRDRMVVFGGYDNGLPGDRDDVWTLTFTGTPTWSQMSPSGTPPAARELHSAVYDGPRNRMVIFGGYAPSTTDGETNDAWALSLTGSGSWSQINASGGPPHTRYGHTAVVDAPRNRMIVFGGFSDLTPVRTLDDVWTLNLTNPIKWIQLSPTGPVPIPTPYFASVYDPVRQRMIAFSADEFWALNGLAGTPAWSLLAPAGQVPRRRWGAAVAYDAPRQRMLMFGGYVSPENTQTNDLWAYSFGTGIWTRVIPSGGFPAPRFLGTAIYDPVGDRVILFGGNGESVGNETWQLALGGSPAWTQLTPGGTPPTARNGHTAILDAPRNRMIVYGGYDASDLSDVWALSLAGGTSWSQLSPTGGPAPAVSYHTAIFDAPRNRMLAFGGNGGSNTVWALSLAGSPAWSTLTTAGTSPPWMVGHVAAYDATRDRMLVGGNPDFNATYALSLSGTPTWGAIGLTTPPPTARVPAGSIFDAGNERWVVFGGNFQGSNFNDVVALSFPPVFPLNVAASPTEGGAVQQDPAGECQLSGAQLTLTAVPAANYAFIGWSGDATGTTNPLTVTMTAAKNITANFASYPVNVTVSPAGSGSVTKNPNQATYVPGSQVTLTASGGFTFLGWSGDASGTTNPLIVTVDGPKNITASFQAYTVTTNVAPAGLGSVSKSPNLTLYAPGTTVSLTAVPVAGAAFSAWSGDVAGTDNPVNLLVNGNKNVTASFSIPPPACGAWSLIPVAAAPGARRGAAATWDPVRHRMLIYGGVDFGVANVLWDDLWALTTGGSPSWAQILPQVSGGVGRWDMVATYDPVRDGMILFGGKVGTPGFFTSYSDVYAVSLAGTPALTQITTAGTPPVPRSGPCVIYDPIRDRLLMFGGRTICGFGCTTPWNDVWALTLSGTPTWTQLAPAGTPPPARSDGGAIYDPVRDRMVVLAGNGTTPTGAWALSLSGTPTWTSLNPAGTPHVTSQFQAMYDPVRDRAILVSGASPLKISALDFKNQPNAPLWVQVFPGGTGIGTRDDLSAVYDPDHDLVVVFGGQSPTGVLSSSMRLDLGGGFQVDGGAAHGSALASQWCYGSGETATVLAAPDSGYVFNQWLGDASGTANPLNLTMDGYKVVQAEFVLRTTGVEEPPAHFALEGIHPNPSSGRVSVEYSLARDARVHLGIFDLAGREVATLADGVVAAGRHAAVWDGKVGQGRAPSGIYFAKLVTPAGVWVKRLALAR